MDLILISFFDRQTKSISKKKSWEKIKSADREKRDDMNEALTQLVEYLVATQNVIGSIPVRLFFFLLNFNIFHFEHLLRRIDET